MKRFLLFFFIVFSCFTVSCATVKTPPVSIHPVSKMFSTDYERVWRAMMLALESYPIATEDNEKGFLKTEPIRYGTIWKSPFEQKKDLSSATYIIRIQLIKGKSKSLPVVKAIIYKDTIAKKGFFRDAEKQLSNGLEEKAILYRIIREIKIEQAIMNHHRTSSS